MPAPTKTSLAALLALAACAPPPPSVLLISLDTTRADRLGCYGYERGGTPHLDAIAARGVRFDSAHTVAPLTLPAHASLLTGTLPPQHGVRDNGTYRVADELVTLAELFAGEGFRTAAFVSAFPLYRHFGLDQGFELYDHPPNELEENRTMTSEERPAAETTRVARAWLERLSADEPFFAWVHYFDPHWAYAPPEPFASTWRDDPYQGEIAAMDASIGTLIEALEAAGRLEDTFVIAVADHGEALGHRGEETHGMLIYGPTTQIPLVAAGPGLPAGVAVGEPVSIADVFPTLAELFDLRVSGDVRGASLVPTWSGGAREGDAVYVESLYPRLHFGWSELEAVVDGSHKYVEAPAVPVAHGELYDQRSDPGELTDVARSDVERTKALRGTLNELRAGMEPLADAGRELGASEAELLSALGYVSTTVDTTAIEDLPHPATMIQVMVRANWARVFLVEGRVDEALGLLAEMEELDPDGRAVHEIRGLYHYVQAGDDPERLDQAIAEYTRAVEITPSEVELWRLLAELHEKKGDYAQALLQLERAMLVAPVTKKLAQDERDLRARAEARVRALRAEGRGAEADELEAALATDP